MNLTKLFYSIISLLILLSASFVSNAASIAYIHGRVAEDGTILNEAEGAPYDQMLLDDTGSTGLSEFKALVEQQGHNIEQFRDQNVALDDSFLRNYDLIIFGLHQKIWSASERNALDEWLNSGGGVFLYSDSASGGRFNIVGAQNPVGQTVTNNLIADYGMQVTVDQADGVPREEVNSSASIESIRGLTLEGEGVSPIVVSELNTDVEILIPYSRNVSKLQNITIEDPTFASLVLRPVGQGHIAVMFDRQPMWNNGPGSDIDEEDNRGILSGLVNFLSARTVTQPPVDTPITPSPGGPRLDGANSIPVILQLLLDN